MERKSVQLGRTDSEAGLVEQVKIYLQAGDYTRALDLFRSTGAEFSKDPELSQLHKRAHDGLERNAEAQRLITESQTLFAGGQSIDAIQLLRKAYELDKTNPLSRAILANSLVEHAHSILESDWLEAETLTHEALRLNPAHPTAKTIFNLIFERKRTCPVEEWVSRARKLQSSGDVFAALAWVAEGLAVHPDNPKLLQVQNAVQYDQGARRRQTRRGDLDSLRRMEREIEGTIDDTAKHALAERIQSVAAKYWTDGEILSIANGLLQRMGLSPQEGLTAAESKNASLIFHVPRVNNNSLPAEASEVALKQLPRSEGPIVGPASGVSAVVASARKIAQSEIPAGVVPAAGPVATLPAQLSSIVKPGSAPGVEPSASASQISQAKKPTRPRLAIPILVSVAAMILCAATFLLTRRYYAEPVVKDSAATSVSASGLSASAVEAADASNAAISSAPAPSASAVPSSTLAPTHVSSDKRNVTPEKFPSDSGRRAGRLLVVAGQDNAKVLLNGNAQPQLTQAGQLVIPNLESGDYVIQVSKAGFLDSPQQKIRIRKGEEETVVFNLQAEPRIQPQLSSLTIQGGAPGTTVMLDQTPAGTIQADGTLLLSSVIPGDHSVELRKEGFKPRVFRERFVAGGAIPLGSSDVALEAAPGELKINFAPSDARVALVKGSSLTMVSSGVPLNLGAGTYTLTARTADRFARSFTVEVAGGQSRTLDLTLAPAGMSMWDDPGGWKQEKGSFLHRGGDFVLYGIAPVSGTFLFSAMPTKGHLLQWVINYADPKNYILFQIDDNNFYRSVIRNGEKTGEIKIPEKAEKRNFRTLRIRVSRTELLHEMKDGENWNVVDRWTQPGANLGLGKFGFYLPGNDEVAISGFAYYADLSIK